MNNNSKELYAITIGEYDDYQIITLTDNEEKANKIRDIYNYETEINNFAKVEKYIDNGVNELGITWCVNNFFGQRGINASLNIYEEDEHFNKYKDGDWIAYVKANSRSEAIQKACEIARREGCKYD